MGGPALTSLAPTMQAFFIERLGRQRQASPRTIAAYRDTFKLLLGFAQDRSGKKPSALGWEDLGPEMVMAFLDYLEADRGNSARTRNARLAAVRSLFHYAALRHPEHAALIQQVLAIPQKRYDKPIVGFLTLEEMEALVGAPRSDRWEGRRDRAMLLLAAQTGLRVSELIGLDCGDVSLGAGACVSCSGKGRKQRAVPLSRAAQAALRAWMIERAGKADDPLFPTRTGRRLSRDAVARRVSAYTKVASPGCPSLSAKRPHPHLLRHSCAMSLLQAGVDTSVISLWLGHADARSTQPYVHADMAMKERALERMAPLSAPVGRYRAPDPLLSFLESL